MDFLINKKLNILKSNGKGKIKISQSALDLMLRYPWPGNIRELQNTIQYALLHCKESSIAPNDLPPEISSFLDSKKSGQKRKRKRKLDPILVTNALGQAGGNKVEAARILGVARATLYRFFETEN